jgi:ribosomal protein S18 acetylase RimI-like enzyme
VPYRPYQPADFAALYAIEEACFEPPVRFSRRYLRRLLSRADAAAWVAEAEGRLAGFAIVGWSGPAAARWAYVETIEVLAGQRRGGVGGELLRRLEASALAAGAGLMALHVDAENAAAIRLYEAHGYRQAGREENFYPQGRAALVFRKLLPL